MFVGGPHPDRCYHWWPESGGSAGFTCAQATKDPIHSGMSPLGDGLVRSDYERALERIRELEADVVSLRSQRQVLMDSERTLNAQLAHMTASRNHEAAANVVVRGEWAECEEERLQASTRAKELMLRLDASLARECGLQQRLQSLDTLAREITERVEQITSAIDKR